MSSSVRRPVRVNLKEGLHLRPLTRLSQVASRYPCDVRLIMGEKSANAKTMLELMALGAMSGTELIVETDGDEAEPAAEAIVSLFESNFDVPAGR